MAVPRKSTKTAQLILRGGYQYVILPKEFEFKGKAVHIQKQGDAVILEPTDLRRHPLSEDFTPGKRH
jgi:virulence-associated protein VagC